ncbi:MAG: STAS domain-containing protein [Oscillospiraceae bacterium]|nr:STAS domain-containing protein [Oscillospiraceae bacterium]
MEIKKTITDYTGVLTLSGRLDTVTSPKLQEALAELMSSSDKIELDFSEIGYVSSAGLRVLLLGHKNASASGKTMTLKNVLPEVMEVFEITGFLDILTII